MEQDSAYYSRRASEERTAAMKSADARARRAHLTIARHYDERACAAVEPLLSARAS